MAGEFQTLVDRLATLDEAKARQPMDQPKPRQTSRPSSPNPPILFTKAATGIDEARCRRLASEAIASGALTAAQAARIEIAINAATSARLAKAMAQGRPATSLADWSDLAPARNQGSQR